MITAIATSYNGIKFRSRLEARWSMFLDLLQVDHRYEHEGFQLESGWYLPDFWIPSLKTWLEIKPPFNREYEAERDRWRLATNLCIDLATTTKARVIMASSSFGDWLPAWEEVSDNMSAFFPNGDSDYPYLPCLCPECGKLGFEFEGCGARICKHGSSDRGHSADHHRIVRAIEKVNAHSFWNPSDAQ